MSDYKTQIEKRASRTFIHVTSILFNSSILVIWIICQFLISWLTSIDKIDWLTMYLILSFRIIFALSTLIPILVAFYEDITIIIIQAQEEIKSKKNSIHLDSEITNSEVEAILNITKSTPKS